MVKERGLNINDVQRFLRVVISYHIFSEPQIGGYVVHFAASRLLVDNFMLEAWIMNIADEFWLSLSRTEVSNESVCLMLKVVSFRSDGAMA
ncbi:hypothetical protein BPOR_1226g00010 [Botrytis porri]|uniref:Uncharacterized protein n=1 Tax=Botrytis porri TaxID=87229 RepID=A0A4Z1K744_9HELO|nr:hypothetical protein BPOR_1226g00010 [Botrytis porri]